MPAAPPRRPAEAALFDGTRLALDGHTALEERVAEFEGIVLRGELPSDVTLPEDDAGAAAAVAEQYALYAARLFRAVAPPDDANARRFAAATEEHTLAALDVHHDPRRLDWSLRELPRIAKNLRGAISALPASWEGKIVVEAAGAAETGVKSWWRGRKAQRTTVPLPRAGVELPVLGLGTCWLDENESEASVGAALAWAAAHPAAPPVHIDSAEAYRNEAAVGRALAQFGPGRAFLASKLSDRAHLSYDGAKARVAETLRFFGVETVDLYSLHSAFNFLNDAKARADLAGAWRALVELQQKGTLRALGVSNFNAVELRAFAEDPALGGIWVPDVLQNKVDVYRRGEQEPGEDDVLAAAKELDIAVVAYSSLSGWPRGVGARADPLLRQLAARRGVDVPTLILRWHVDSGHAAIPRSRDAGHVAENLDALARAREPLAPAERAAIDAIPHLVAGPRNRPATADAFRVRGGARPEL